MGDHLYVFWCLYMYWGDKDLRTSTRFTLIGGGLSPINIAKMPFLPSLPDPVSSWLLALGRTGMGREGAQITGDQAYGDFRAREGN